MSALQRIGEQLSEGYACRIGLKASGREPAPEIMISIVGKAAVVKPAPKVRN